MLRKNLAFRVVVVIGCWVMLSLLSSTIIFAQTKREVVAVVNGRNITLADADTFIPAQYQLAEPQQLYALRKVATENFIIRALLEEEAKRRRISVEALRKQMTLGKIEVSNIEVEHEYLENAVYFAAMSPDEAKERIRLDLENEARMKLYRAAITRLKAKAKIEIRLKEPPSLPQNTRNITHPSKGSSNPKVTIIEFSDFRCPYCRESQDVLKKVLADYPADVKLVYKHLPLQTNPQGLIPAIAANCAEAQGHFWQFHDSLFTAKDLSLESIKRIATEIKLDLPTFDTCLTSDIARTYVLNDLKEATRLNLTATPTFIINGKIHSGKLDFNEFKTIIDRELTAPQPSEKK